MFGPIFCPDSCCVKGPLVLITANVNLRRHEFEDGLNSHITLETAPFSSIGFNAQHAPSLGGMVFQKDYNDSSPGIYYGDPSDLSGPVTKWFTTDGQDKDIHHEANGYVVISNRARPVGGGAAPTATTSLSDQGIAPRAAYVGGSFWWLNTADSKIRNTSNSVVIDLEPYLTGITDLANNLIYDDISELFYILAYTSTSGNVNNKIQLLGMTTGLTVYPLGEVTIPSRAFNHPVGMTLLDGAIYWLISDKYCFRYVIGGSLGIETIATAPSAWGFSTSEIGFLIFDSL